jgi:hypothetical protein
MSLSNEMRGETSLGPKVEVTGDARLYRAAVRVDCRVGLLICI